MADILFNVVVAALELNVGALGFWLVCRVRGFFDFGFAVAISFGGYAAIHSYGLAPNVAVCFFGAAIGTALVGFAVDQSFVSPLKQRGATPLMLLVGSLGVMTVGQSLLATFWGDGARVIAVAPQLVTIFGLAIPLYRVFICVAAVVVFLPVLWAFQRTEIGLRIRALIDSEELARSSGVDVEQLGRIAVTVGYALAGVYGSFLLIDAQIRPTSGLLAITSLLLIVCIARSNQQLLLAGSTSVAFVNQFASWLGFARWLDLVVGAILLAALLHMHRRPSYLQAHSR